MEENQTINLIKVAKELSIGTGTIVDFLASKGYRVEKSPMAKLTKDMYQALLDEFNIDKILNEKKITIGKVQLDPVENAFTSPTELALSLITECIRTNHNILDLGNCGLKSADFAVNMPVDKLLRKCTHIVFLSLSNYYDLYEEFDSIPKKIECKNPGAKNFLTEIPTSLRALKNLTTFICCGNLDDEWGIRSLDILSNHIQLKYLDMSYNNIDTLKDIKKLTSVKTFILHHNKIRFINNLFRLPLLNIADVHSNLIEKIPAISKNTSIISLDLHNNQIQEIFSLEKHVNLKQLLLQRNRIFQISSFEPLILKDDTFYLQIDENPIVNDFQLKLLADENHFAFVKEILQRKLDQSDKVEIQYPVKILVFGNHSAGKSTLVNFLTNSNSEGSTHILRIVNYNINVHSDKILPDAIFFDFGGQDFYHGVYRAFVSENALQLILFNQLTDYNGIGEDVSGIPIINFNRNYWLGQKNYQENNKTQISPYILVQTHGESVSEEPIAIDYLKYAGHQKTFDLSLKLPFDQNTSKYTQEFYEMGKSYFQKYLNSIIQRLQISNLEPLWYANFLQYILNRETKNHKAFTIDEILTHYGSTHLTDEERKQSLITNLTQLHRFGLILYYSNIPGLTEISWLNPQRLVEHIQNDLLSKTFADTTGTRMPGIIAKSEFEQIVTDEKIILLLEAQSVIFLHDPTGNLKDQEYIVPNYLPLMKKDDIDMQLFTFGLEQSNFVIKFDDFIPFGFVNQMICFYGKLPDAKRFWRNKLLFTINKEIRVLIDLDFEALKIKFHFQCLQKKLFSQETIMEYLFFSIMGLYWNINTETIFSFSEFIENRNMIIDENAVLGLKTATWENLKIDQQYIPEDAYISLNDQDYISYFNLYSLPKETYSIDTFKIAKNKINTYKSKAVSIGQFKPFTAKKLAIMKKNFCFLLKV